MKINVNVNSVYIFTIHVKSMLLLRKVFKQNGQLGNDAPQYKCRVVARVLGSSSISVGNIKKK